MRCSAGVVVQALLYASMTGMSGTAALRVPITVKDIQNVNINQFPIDVVVPLPKGNAYSIANLAIDGFPSQVKELERWPSDNSLRTVLVHFQVTRSPATPDPPGGNQYFLVDRAPQAPIKSVTVSEAGNVITVDTGKIRFTVNKKTFTLIDELWVDRDANGVYSDSEKVVVANTLNGGHMIPRTGAGNVQYDSARTDVTFRIEERGPMRVVLRAEALTAYTSPTNHQHGFAVRLYAYANQPYIKVDYQLQNSAKNVKRSWPLYLEALNIDLRLAMTDPNIIFGSTDGVPYSTKGAASLAQERHDAYAVYNRVGGELKRRSNMKYGDDYRNGTAFMHLEEGNVAVTAIGRNFWQMWPNGLKFQGGKMTVELFPSWSAQWEQGDDNNGRSGRISPTGLYWIKDMQHVYKETLLVFHPNPPSKLSDVQNLAATFQFRPVGFVSADWQRSTRAALDLGGYLPTVVATFSPGRPTYEGNWDSYYNDASLNVDKSAYSCTVRAWGDPEVGYRNKAYTAGGLPYSNERFLALGDPLDYFLGELMAIGELNVRPQWMAGYNFARDQSFLRLTTNPYPPDSWRVFDGHGISVYATDLLTGTIDVEPDMVSRDDAHGWFYHVFHSYQYTGNPWVKDWYEFIVEFRKIRLSQGDPVPPMADREVAHSLHHAYQASRVAIDPNFGKNVLFYLRNYMRPVQDLVYGQQTTSEAGGGFQTGFLMRAIIAYMEESRDVDFQGYAEAFQYLSGQMAWNLYYGNFAYYLNPSTNGETPGLSDGTGLTLVDPQSWYYWNTGRKEFWDHVQAYVVGGGVNGGTGPFGAGFGSWSGQYEGRMYNFVVQSVRTDTSPPSPISDLVALRKSTGQSILIQWTSPKDALRFHVVWSDRPISESQTNDKNVRNWWAAETIGTGLVGVAGSVQRLEFDVGSKGGGNVYVAMFSFDASNNMSRMSKSVLATTSTWWPSLAPTKAPTTTPPFTACFSEMMKVPVFGRGDVEMRHLQLGDLVLTANQKFEPIYSFGHRSTSTAGTLFYQIHPVMLELTADHMVFIQHKGFVPASMVRVGDSLSTGDKVTRIKLISNRSGVYAPFTPSGTLIIQGVLASSYISFQGSDVLMIGCYRTWLSYQWLAHTFQWPHRQWCKWRRCETETYSEEGIAEWVAYPLRVAQLLILLLEPQHQIREHSTTLLVTILIPMLFHIGWMMVWRRKKVT
jgi:hypothetical protein